MNAEEKRARVKQAHKEVFKGPAGSAQNQLRMDFYDHLEHCWSLDPDKPEAEILQESIAEVRRNHPDFEPQFSHDYFGF